MRRLVSSCGLDDLVEVDSAGTHDYHVGEAPDPRAQAAARRRGYDLSMLRARQVTMEDFGRFDLLLAMDFNNLGVLQAACPIEYQDRLGLLMPYATQRCASIVHDPYYRSAKDFDLVLDCIEDGCIGLLRHLAQSDAPSTAHPAGFTKAMNRPEKSGSRLSRWF